MSLSPKKRVQNIQMESPKDKKQKRNRKNFEEIADDDNDTAIATVKSNTPLKLTFKIGGQTLGEKSVIKSEITPSYSKSLTPMSLNHEENDDEEMNEYDEEIAYDEESGELEDDDDMEQPKDEEEEWFDALEEGRLHEVDDELKKIRDPKLMTARQRALFENKSLKKKEDAMRLLAAESSKRVANDTVMSEEFIQRKMLKARRRRQMAEEKKEKDKKQTIDRLLRKKQEAAGKVKRKKILDQPKVTYKNNHNGIFICLPQGVAIQLLQCSTDTKPPEPASVMVRCAREGCQNRKKYTCSKTKLPLCSFDCYKQVNQLM